MAINRDSLERMMEDGSPRKIPPFCIHCGYNLTGAVSDRCPECGHYFIHKDWRRKAAELRQQAYRMEEVNEWAIRGLKVALGSLVVLAPCLLVRGNLFVSFFRCLTLVGGLSAMFLGLGVFRAPKGPDWARDLLVPTPDYGIATAANTIPPNGASCNGIRWQTKTVRLLDTSVD